MPEVLAFTLKPVVRVQQLGGLYVVSVRPTPEGILADSAFDKADDAAEYATALRIEHGWPIRPDHFDRTLPGAA